MTKWKKASEELGELIGESVSEYEVEFRKMFGSPVYFVNGNMFIGVHGDGIMLRLQEEDQQKLYDEYDEAAPFTPNGRRMREYALIPPVVYDDEIEFRKWLDISYSYVSSLPKKEKKEKKKKSASKKTKKSEK